MIIKTISKQRYLILSVIFGTCVACFIFYNKYLNTHCFCPKSVFTKKTSYAESILDITKWKIDLDMRWFQNFNGTLSKLDAGGTPIRSLIVSTWRSGSSFLGDILEALPSNYYQFEPFVFFGSSQIIKSNLTKTIKALRSFFQCDFNNVPEYFEHIRNSYNYRYPNKLLWEYCELDRSVCENAEVVGKFCELFLFQTIKIVRLRLAYIEELIKDKGLNIKTVLLVRDPRAVMHSRSQVDFCTTPDCAESRLLCARMVSDYYSAKEFRQKYPGKIMVLRFEDLVQNINATTTNMLNFLRLPFHKSVDEFISTHTSVESGGAYSTYRVSQNVATKWRKLMKFEQVDNVQKHCQEAMQLWGYNLVNNLTQYADNFQHIQPYAIV